MAETRTKLSPLENEIWDFLLGYAADYDNGHNEYETPTYREIAIGVKMKKGKAQRVRRVLKQMEKKGYVTLGKPYEWRGLKLVTIKNNHGNANKN